MVKVLARMTVKRTESQEVVMEQVDLAEIIKSISLLI